MEIAAEETMEFQAENPVEYFRELIEAAMKHQHVTAGDLTSFYLVNMLTGFVRPEPTPAAGANEGLGARFFKALRSNGWQQRSTLRQVGDRSLFISGYFPDSLNRSLVDVDWYIDLGSQAYTWLSRQEEEPVFGYVFNELADKFVGFADVLSEVSEQACLSSNADILRLYEKWLRTKSPRTGKLLATKGIVPNASLRKLRVQ